MIEVMEPESDHASCARMTLQELDEADRDVRAWCFACERGKVIDTNIWMKFAARGWPMTLDQAASRFRCEACGSVDQVSLFPVKRPPAPPNAPSLLVEAFFHGMRSKRKRGDHDIVERTSARLIAALKKREEGGG